MKSVISPTKSRITGKPLSGSHVVILGVTYKPNVKDTRETPARPLVGHLFDLGAEVSFVDPYVESFAVGDREVRRICDIEEAVGSADIVVLLQPHDEFLIPDALATADQVFDTTGHIFGMNVERL